jgi:osmotically-inducible protein OsmY
VQREESNLQAIRLGAVILASWMLLSILGCAATPTRQSTGGYIDDATITTKVKAAIAADQKLAVLQIKVITYKGIVELSGFVDSEQTKERAGEIASQVSGVKELHNSLIVKTAVSG